MTLLDSLSRVAYTPHLLLFTKEILITHRCWRVFCPHQITCPVFPDLPGNKEKTAIRTLMRGQHVWQLRSTIHDCMPEVIVRNAFNSIIFGETEAGMMIILRRNTRWTITIAAFVCGIQQGVWYNYISCFKSGCITQIVKKQRSHTYDGCNYLLLDR